MRGGPCRYDAFRSTVVITDIRVDTETNSSYEDGARLLFGFEPAFPWRLCDFPVETWPREGVQYTINGGMDPCLLWIRAEEIEVGNEYRATRQDIIEGTYARVIYRILRLDESWRQWRKTG